MPLPYSIQDSTFLARNLKLLISNHEVRPMTLSELLQSRLYAQVMETFLGFIFVAGAVMAALWGWMMTKDPETGALIGDFSWVGLWVFIGGLILLAYASVTFGVLAVALRRYSSCRNDPRSFALGAYLMLPVFPIGTAFALYAIRKLRSDNKWAEPRCRTGNNVLL
jgi:ABC-type dipeptide/oligopeptide/nickel transport system permease component